MLDIHFERFPTLETDRLTLRQLTLDDAETLFALRTNPEVTRYLDHINDENVAATVKLIETIDSRYASGDGINWAITLRNSPASSSEIIGVVSLWRIDKVNHRGEAGYMLHPDMWGQGMMTEAFRAVLDYGFKVINLHSVEANTSVGNVASQALLLKCGFVKEAHFRENWYFDGKFFDSLIYCKLASDSVR